MLRGAMPLGIVEPDAAGFSVERLRRIDGYLELAIENQQIPSAAVLIARNGQIAYQTVAGMRDVESGDRLEMDAIYRIASMSKPITSVAVMMLYEEGLFQLEDPVSKFIPEFAEPRVFGDGDDTVPAKCEISIRHLLTHTSGLSYGDARLRRLAEQSGLTGYPVTLTTGELVRGFAQFPLVHHPGEAWTYGTSVIALGHLVEVLSGMALDVFLRERIFEPLGMCDTGFLVSEEKRGRLTPVYTRENGKLIRVSNEPFQFGLIDWSMDFVCREPQTCFMGGEGLTSTLYDYTRFAQMLLNSGELNGVRLLGRKTVDRMAENSIGDLNTTVAVSLQGDKMGLGVGIRADRGVYGGLESVGSFGWGGAFTTVFWVDPVEDLVGVVMAQVRPSNVDFLNACRVLVYQAMI